jgi:hypothetical protein
MDDEAPPLDAIRQEWIQLTAKLEGILDALDKIWLKYKTAWVNLNQVYNEAVLLHALCRVLVAMLSPEAGIDDQPGFRSRFMPVVHPVCNDKENRFSATLKDLQMVVEGKSSSILRWHQDSDAAWNQTFIRPLQRLWLNERTRLEKGLGHVRL